MSERTLFRRSASTSSSCIVAMVGFASLIGGCNGQREQDRAEASKVFRALEMARAAPNETKRRPAEELAHTPCTSPIVCATRDSCADAYQHLAKGTEAALRVKSELDQLEKTPPPSTDKVAELSAELDRADQEINGAKDSLRKCEEAASIMRRTFGI